MNQSLWEIVQLAPYICSAWKANVLVADVSHVSMAATVG